MICEGFSCQKLTQTGRGPLSEIFLSDKSLVSIFYFFNAIFHSFRKVTPKVFVYFAYINFYS